MRAAPVRPVEREASDALRQGAASLGVLLDEAADAALLVDGRGMVVYANARAVALFGAEVASGRSAGLSLVDLDRGAPLTEQGAAWPELAARARAQALRLLATARLADGGTMPVELSLWPVRTGGRPATGVWVRDRSETLRMQRRTQELERQLHQSQKLETIGRLAGGIAHDFNNLLTIITGYAELLVVGQGVSPDIKASLEQVCEAAGRAAQLTGQLLAFSRQRPAAPSLVDLNRLVRRESDMLRRLVDEDIELVTHLASGLPTVRGDAGRFAQLVMNLVLNARDAMPSGGRLSVDTALVTAGEQEREHAGVTTPGTYVQLTVADTGIGMTAEERARVFEPFYTTKGAGFGTGIGMTTVRTIVEESNGFIALSSRVGHGTTVRVYLPAASQPSRDRATITDASDVPGGRETVLVVEDNAAVRALIEAVLSDHGYAVLSACDGNEALQQLDRAPTAVQLVVSDVVMPHRNGRAVVAYAQGLNPRIKALYLSGYTEDAIVRQGILRDDVAFLQKPFSPAALLREVRAVLDA